MEEPNYIHDIAIVALVVIGLPIVAFLISNIQIRVWLYYIEKFLLNKSNKSKLKEDEQEQKK